MTSQNVHDSFNNISSEETFSLEIISKELLINNKRNMKYVKLLVEDMKAAVRDNTPLNGLCFPSIQKIKNDHNASIIIEGMIKKGKDTITLNPSIDLSEQIIKLANKEERALEAKERAIRFVQKPIPEDKNIGEP